MFWLEIKIKAISAICKEYNFFLIKNNNVVIKLIGQGQMF